MPFNNHRDLFTNIESVWGFPFFFVLAKLLLLISVFAPNLVPSVMMLDLSLSNFHPLLYSSIPVLFLITPVSILNITLSDASCPSLPKPPPLHYS